MGAAVALAPTAAAQVPCPLPDKPDQVAVALAQTNAVRLADATLPLDSADSARIEDERRREACKNITTAPKIIAVQPGITVVATAGFMGAITSRLDSVRGEMGAAGAVTTSAGLAPDGLMGLGAGARTRTPPPTPASPLTIYAMGTFLGGSRADTPSLFGLDYDASSGTVGIEYSVNRNLILGLAGNYTATNADVTGGATVDVSAIQGAAYLSYATRQWFLDLLVGYGSHDIDLARPGLPDPLRGSTSANAFALAARTGYLFDFGGLRAGPIAGLSYVHSRVDGYTEKGDPSLALTVSALTLDSFAGSVGIRFLAPFRAGGNIVVPYLNITLEHQFGDLDSALAANLASAPALPPILSSFTAFDARNFGKVEGGITLELGPELSASISGATTFAREESHDFRVSAGLNYRF